MLLAAERLDADVDLNKVAETTDGFSGSDLKALCTAAAMAPVRELLRATGRSAQGQEQDQKSGKEQRKSPPDASSTAAAQEPHALPNGQQGTEHPGQPAGSHADTAALLTVQQPHAGEMGQEQGIKSVCSEHGAGLSNDGGEAASPASNSAAPSNGSALQASAAIEGQPLSNGHAKEHSAAGTSSREGPARISISGSAAKAPLLSNGDAKVTGNAAGDTSASDQSTPTPSQVPGIGANEDSTAPIDTPLSASQPDAASSNAEASSHDEAAAKEGRSAVVASNGAGAVREAGGANEDVKAARHAKWAALLEHMVSDCDRMAQSQSAVRPPLLYIERATRLPACVQYLLLVRACMLDSNVRHYCAVMHVHMSPNIRVNLCNRCRRTCG